MLGQGNSSLHDACTRHGGAQNMKLKIFFIPFFISTDDM